MFPKSGKYRGKKKEIEILKNNKIHVFITTFRKSTRNFAKQFSKDVESLPHQKG